MIYRLLFFILFCTYCINSSAQDQEFDNSTKPLRFDTMNVIPTDTITSGKKLFRIQTGEKYNSTLLPKAIKQSGAVFELFRFALVDNTGQIQNYTITGYDISLTVKGAFVTVHSNNYYITSVSENMKIGDTAIISNIEYIDLANKKYKRTIDEFEFIRIK